MFPVSARAAPAGGALRALALAAVAPRILQPAGARLLAGTPRAARAARPPPQRPPRPPPLQWSPLRPLPQFHARSLLWPLWTSARAVSTAPPSEPPEQSRATLIPRTPPPPTPGTQAPPPSPPGSSQGPSRQPPFRVPHTVVPQARAVPPKQAAPIPRTLAFHLTKEKTWLGRLGVRLKWALIRNSRPFNMDEKIAFFSYIVWGHILWIVLGTTTFVSLVVWAVSKFRAEDALARFLSRLVTREVGLRVVFDEAIMPDWKSGAIALHNVRVQRQPLSPADDGNYTQFDVGIDTLSVKVSVRRWLSGRGFVESLEAKGVRGTLDRRFLQFDPAYDPTQHRRKARRGDFHLKHVKLEDAVLTVLQPDTAPFELRLFSCELPRLRRQWLLYDMLNARFVTGSFDNAMFSLHARQLPTAARVQRLRVDDVDVRHLTRGARGMFGWIESGRCDFLADISLPEPERATKSEQWQDLFERWEAQIRSLTARQRPAEIVTQVERAIESRESQKTVTIDLRVRFRQLRARAPLYAPNLTYWNNALIHPIIAYVNSRDTYIPVHCYVAKRLNDLDGSWTLYDSGLMADLSTELYNAFARDAQDDAARQLRIKKVGFWSLQFMAQLVLLTLGIVA